MLDLFVVWQFVLRVFVFGDGLLMMTVQLADTGAPLGVMRSNHLLGFRLLGSRSRSTFCIDVGVAVCMVVGGGGRFVRGLGRFVFLAFGRPLLLVLLRLGLRGLRLDILLAH